MPRHSAYNPDYESLYSGVEITPDVLHVLRTSDRKMRYMEHQLKTGRFVEDQEQRVAKFLPSRETSLDEMIEKESTGSSQQNSRLGRMNCYIKN